MNNSVPGGSDGSGGGKPAGDVRKFSTDVKAGGGGQSERGGIVNGKTANGTTHPNGSNGNGMGSNGNTATRTSGLNSEPSSVSGKTRATPGGSGAPKRSMASSGPTQGGGGGAGAAGGGRTLGGVRKFSTKFGAGVGDIFAALRARVRNRLASIGKWRAANPHARLQIQKRLAAQEARKLSAASMHLIERSATRAFPYLAWSAGIQGAVDVLSRPLLNASMSGLSKEATRIAGREIHLGTCRAFNLAGMLFGLGSAVEIGPVTVGAASVEKSTLEIERLKVEVSLLRSVLASLVQLRPSVGVNLVASKPKLHLKQAENFSWFGFPDDTTPSSRPTISLPPPDDQLHVASSSAAASFSSFSSSSSSSSSSPAPPVSEASTILGGDALPLHIKGISLNSGTITFSTHADAVHGEKPREIRNVKGRVNLNWDTKDPLRSLDIEVQGSPVARLCEDPRHTMTCDGPRNRRTTPEIPAKKISSGGGIRATMTMDLDEVHGKPPVQISVFGKQLHAPLLENILEIPLDIYDGRVDGNISISFDDLACLDELPRLEGRLKCSSLHFHFHDAPDDLFDTQMDLLFEDERMYLHNAHGYYGAIPIQASGDIDIKLDDAQYRISAHVPGVDVNALSATLGARPSAFPMAGFVGGDVSVTGPLEYPVFSGTAKLASAESANVRWGRPSAAAQYLPEPSTRADEALAAAKEKHADIKAAYDKVPIADASVWFTFDSSTSIFTVHEAQGTTLAGGEINVHGSMDISPSAEEDPRAVNMTVRGQDLPSSDFFAWYMPSGTGALPPFLRQTGPAILSLDIAGSHLCPEVSAAVSIPENGASCTIHSTRQALKVSGDALSVKASALLHTTYPPLVQVKAAKTYREAEAAAKPFIAGCDVDCAVNGLDLMLLASDTDTLQSGPMQPLRLKLSGTTAFRGRAREGPKARSLDSGLNESMDTPGFGVPGVPGSFSGDISMKGLKLNQLMLAPELKGKLLFSNGSITVQAKGRQNDLLIFDSRSSAVDDVLTFGSMMPAMTGYRKGRLSVRRGPLRIDAHLAERGMNLEMQSLNLDDLELASLRGFVNEAAVELDTGSLQGRGRVRMSSPKFSGLKGESLQGNVRWEGDIIRLERVVFQQERSTYQLQGEYNFPSKFSALAAALQAAGQEEPQSYDAMPSSSSSSGPAAVGAAPPAITAALVSEAISGGRWRCSAVVPKADVEEMLPAARIWAGAGAKQTWGEYSMHKAAFIDAVRNLSFQARTSDPERVDELRGVIHGKEVKRSSFPLLEMNQDPSDLLADAMDTFFHESDVESSVSADPEVALGSRSEVWTSCLDNDTASLASGGMETDTDLFEPKIQDLRGTCSLLINSYGGGGGPSAVEFDIRGEDLEWSNHKMQLVALGEYHSLDGLRVEKFNIASGAASLDAKGSYFGPRDNRLHIQVCELPVNWFEPLTEYVGRRFADGFALPKIAGVIYAQGNLLGSADLPFGDLKVSLLDGVVNDDIELSFAQASMLVKSDHMCRIQAKVVPNDGGRDATRESYISLNAELPFDGGVLGVASELKRGESPVERNKNILVNFSVKNNGMLLLSTLSPSVKWVKGNADISLRTSGTLSQPVFKGFATVSKATVTVPSFTQPILVSSANVSIEDDVLRVKSLDAKTGRKGDLCISGSIPISRATSKKSDAAAAQGLLMSSSGLELRDRKNAFAAHVQTELVVRGSLLRPVLSGAVSISKGTFYVSSSDLATEKESAPESTSTFSSFAGLSNGARTESTSRYDSRSDEVDESSVAASVGSDAAAALSSDTVVGDVDSGESPENASALHEAVCRDLKIHIGPDVRAVYPFVLNFSVAGDLVFNGPADPKRIGVEGVIHFLAGEVNLVATQLILNRENDNTAIFKPDQGIDPTIDIALDGGELRAVMKGPASQWQNAIVLTKQAGQSGDVGAPLSPSDIARVFEGQFSGILLEENGQLAISKMAATTVETVLPKYETHGHFGKTKWRLLASSTLPPALFNSDIRDPLKLVPNLVPGMASTAEVQYGSKLKGAISKRLLEKESDTFWQLMYHFKKNLKAQITSSSSSAPHVFIAYSTDALR